MEEIAVLEAPASEAPETGDVSVISEPQIEEVENPGSPENAREISAQSPTPPDAIQTRAFVPSIRQNADGTRTSVQIMTGDIARDGMIVEPEGMDFSNFEKNPVLLWGHGWGSPHGNVPIGRCDNIRQSKDGNWVVDTIFDEDDFSQLIESKVKSGSVRAVSISWRTLDGEYRMINERETWVVTRAELLELSYVSVPADPNAVVTERQQAAYMKEVLGVTGAELVRELEEKVSRLTSTLDTVMKRLDEAQETVRDVKAARSVENIPAEPAPSPAPVRYSERVEDYTQTVSRLMPVLERLVDNAIDKYSGSL